MKKSILSRLVLNTEGDYESKDPSELDPYIKHFQEALKFYAHGKNISLEEAYQEAIDQLRKNYDYQME